MQTKTYLLQGQLWHHSDKNSYPNSFSQFISLFLTQYFSLLYLQAEKYLPVSISNFHILCSLKCE